MKAKELLIKMRACPDAIKWVGERTVQEAWNECPRGEWMLWFYVKQYPENKRALALAKGLCANTVRHLMKDERSIKAVDATIAYGNGLISEDDLEKAAADAYAAATYAADADAAATYADAAAAYAAAYATYAANAYATYAAAAAAAYATYAAAAAADVAGYADAAAAAAAAYATYAADADADAYAADDDVVYAEKIENQKLTADICRQYLSLEQK